jgi:hypothetical protein
MSYSNFSISQRMNSRNFNVFSPMLGQGGCSILQVLPTWDANEKPPVAKWETSTHNCRYRAYLRRLLNVFGPRRSDSQLKTSQCTLRWLTDHISRAFRQPRHFIRAAALTTIPDPTLTYLPDS